MKKLLLGFAALSLLVGASSCNKEETRESVTDGTANINFKPAIGKSTTSTRATEFTYWEKVTGQKLDIYSYAQNSTTLFNLFQPEYGKAFTDGIAGVTNQWDANDWGYGDEINQPGYVLRYYSVYPTTNLAVAPTTGAPEATASSYKFDYTVQPVATQEDLIGATTTTILNTVTLKFNHLLSQVNFAVQGIQDVKIEIKNLKVNNVKDKGTYTFGGTPSAWTNLSTVTSPLVYVYEPLADAVTTLAGGSYDNYSGEIVYLGNKGGSVATDNNNDNALMLMPQEFKAETDGTFSFDFCLTVSTKGIDQNGIGVFDDPRTPYETPVIDQFVSTTLNFSDFETKTWLPGKRYLYVIDFTPYLTGGKIRFNVYVNDWEDDEDTTLAETVEVAKPTKMSVEAAIDLHSTANASSSALRVFPISIPGAIPAAFEINKLYGFEKDDVIRIECKDAASTANLTVGIPGWTKTIEDTRVVVFKCTTPTVKGVEATSATADLDAIKAAISALGASSTADTYFTEYTVNVSAAPATIAIDAIAGTYVVGDRIRIIYSDSAGLAGVTLDAGLTATWDIAREGTEVLLTKK